MAAYVPIAGRVFGSPYIGISTKMSFVSSLLLSRILYNVQTLTMTSTTRRRLNSPYMRALRKLPDQSRYSGENECTDLPVRKLLGAASIDAIVLQKRLKYMQRIAVKAPRELCALVQFAHTGERIPWVLKT